MSSFSSSLRGEAHSINEEKVSLLGDDGQRYDGSGLPTSTTPAANASESTRQRPPPINSHRRSTVGAGGGSGGSGGGGRRSSTPRSSPISDVLRTLSSSMSFSYGPTIHKECDYENEGDSDMDASGSSAGATAGSSGGNAGTTGGGGRRRGSGGGSFVGKRPSQKWQSLDVYQSLAGVTRHPTLAHEGYYDQGVNCCFMLWRMMEASILLAITGVLTAIVTLIVNVSVYYFTPVRFLIVSTLDSEHSHWVVASVFTAYLVAMSLVSVVITNNICPEAVGGGIPDVKTVLSGLISQPILSVRLIWAKMLGLIFALIGGLSVGKEGPFVHIAVAISDSLMRLHCFRHCRRNTSKRLEILGCASAAGVASTFGTPFGGVLFSIEVTATYYMVRNLPRAFLCAVCAALVYEVMGLRDTFALFTDDHDRALGYLAFDLLLCCGLGLICGLLGALFVGIISNLCALRNRYLRFSLGWKVVSRRRVWVVLLASVVIAPAVYLDVAYGLHGGDKPLTDYMFQSGIMGVSAPLGVYVVFKFLVTTLCVSLPLPVGLFTPTFVTGGAIGRLFGEMVHHFYPTDRITSLEPWEFAVIGAAAFSSGVTRAVSTAVIVFELSGQNHLRLPISVALLLAYFVANRFTKNVYDELLDTNGTPSLPELPAELYMVTAAQVMRPIDQLPYLTLSSSFADAERLLVKCDGTEWLVPVVDSEESMHLQGAVLAEDLKIAINALYVTLNSLDVDEEEGGEGGGGEEEGEGGKGGLRRRGTFYEEEEEGKVGGMVLDSPVLRGVEEEEEEEEEAVAAAAATATAAAAAAAADSAAPLAFSAVERSGSIGSQGGGESRKGSLCGPSLHDIPLNFVVLQDRDTIDSLTPSHNRNNNPGYSSSCPPSGPSSFFHLSYITRPELIMDPSPYQVADGTLLSKVDFSFRMLKVTQAYVLRSGRLVGVLTRDRLTEFVGTREKRPMHRCMQLLTSCADSVFFCCRRRRRRRGGRGGGRKGGEEGGAGVGKRPRWGSYQVLPPYPPQQKQQGTAAAGEGGGGGGGGGGGMERGGGPMVEEEEGRRNGVSGGDGGDALSSVV